MSKSEAKILFQKAGVVDVEKAINLWESNIVSGRLSPRESYISVLNLIK